MLEKLELLDKNFTSYIDEARKANYVLDKEKGISYLYPSDKIVYSVSRILRAAYRESPNHKKLLDRLQSLGREESTDESATWERLMEAHRWDVLGSFILRNDEKKVILDTASYASSQTFNNDFERHDEGRRRDFIVSIYGKGLPEPQIRNLLQELPPLLEKHV